MNETKKLIDEQWKALPDNLKHAIEKVPWKTLVQEIGNQNTLDEEQLLSLELETMFILYGFENPNDYVSNVTRNVTLSEDTAYLIADSVVEKIFNPISKLSEEDKKPSEPASTLPNNQSNLPMVEEGELIHDVLPLERAAETIKGEGEEEKNEQKAKLPDYRYEAGKDPYREPLQ